MLKTFFFLITGAVCVALSFVITKYCFLNEKKIKKLLYQKSNENSVAQLKAYFKKQNKKNNPLMKYLRVLILKAKLNNPLITPFSVIFVSAVLGIVAFIALCSKIFLSLTIVITLFAFTIPVVILDLLADRNGGKTNSRVIDFIGTVENFLEIKDDINYALEAVTTYDIHPLSDFAADYTYDVHHGYTSIDALKRFSEKLSNAQFKNYFNTLINCSNNSGKYLLVTQRFKEFYLALYEKMQDRQKAAMINRIMVSAFIAIIFLMVFLMAQISPNIYYLLLFTQIGHEITTFSATSIIVTFYTLINVGKFDFD